MVTRAVLPLVMLAVSALACMVPLVAAFRAALKSPTNCRANSKRASLFGRFFFVELGLKCYDGSMTGIIKGPFRDPDLDVSGEIVGFYPREFYVCDNFASFQVEIWGRLWPTSEHAYQASHFFETAPELAEKIAQARSAHDAYKLAKANADIRPAKWEDIKLGIMEEIVRAKLSQHYYIQQKLLQTGNVPIVEDSPKDSFWGWGSDRQGRNELGKLWMRLREELQHDKIALLPEPDYRA
jgi:ribA/ribD-fused uncharacterized protein